MSEGAHKASWRLGVAVTILMTLSAVPASAQLLPPVLPQGSFYTGIEGGWTSLVSTKLSAGGRSIKESFDDQGFSGDWNYPDDLLLGLRAGYDIGAWSIEEEAAYRHSKVFHFGGLPLRPLSSSLFGGQRNSYALLTNVIYNFALPELHLFGVALPPISPHAGLGIGAVNIVDTLALNPDLRAGLGLDAASCCLHGNIWEFAYQGIAGVRFEITPNLLLDIDYRYLGTPSGLHFTNQAGGTITNYTIKGGYQTHHSFLSLIWRFPVEQTMAASPAAASPAR
jgi:opacity protein-like surface antigen